MEEFKKKKAPEAPLKRIGLWIAVLAVSYFCVELFALHMLAPGDAMSLAFGAVWSVLLSCLVMLLPRVPGRILYGISYFAMAGWTIAQTGYHVMFSKIMWIGDALFAGEGGDYIFDVLRNFPRFWYIAGGLLLLMGIAVLLLIPGGKRQSGQRVLSGVLAGVCVAGLVLLPQLVFLRDDKIWGTHSEYARSSSYQATYETMYDAEKVYDICGVYHLTFRDIWQHMLYPRMPWYRHELENMRRQVDDYLQERGDREDNEMTGLLEGKNVILVLMESMDDWMLTPEETPTILRLMEEGIQFSNFYTPGYGGARTINTEFCINSGIFLPTNGGYVFDYVTNDFDQTIASQLTAAGYNAQAFHYNEDSFYSRGVFEPALGYEEYISYMDYTDDEDALYDENFLFDNRELSELFFREGQTFNFLITRSAHLSYVYNEVLSYYALKQYPYYRGLYGHEEIDCARVKAKLVDDMFARLLLELLERDQLDNTVIIGVTDHYTYGFKDVDTMLELSGVEHTLLLEKTPCFIWSADCPNLVVDKTLNTADLLPTVLNLLGIDSPYGYLGQDAFDPEYVGYALFPDGSWISNGVACVTEGGESRILANENNVAVTREQLEQMSAEVLRFMQVSNLMLLCDYYNQ